MKVYTKDSAADIRLFLSTSLPKTFLFSNVIVYPVCIRKQQVCLTFIRANSFNWQREHNVLLFVLVEYRFYRFLVVVILWGSSTRLLAVIKPKYATDKFFFIRQGLSLVKFQTSIVALVTLMIQNSSKIQETRTLYQVIK